MHDAHLTRTEFLRVLAIIFTFGLWPLASFSAANLDSGIELDRIMLYAIVNFLFALIVLVPAFVMSRRRLGTSVFYVFPLIIIVFYFFADIIHLLEMAGSSRLRISLAILCVMFGAMAAATIRFARHSAFKIGILWFGIIVFSIGAGHLAFALAFPSTIHGTIAERTGTKALRTSKVLKRIPATGLETAPNVASRRPNVYYLLPDGHVSPHVLATEFGFSSAKFMSELEALGFTVYDKTWSNYPATRTSVSSTLSMQYLFHPDNRDEKDEVHAIDVRIIQGENKVVEALSNRGYTYVQIPNGFISLFDCGIAADHCFKKPVGLLDVSETDQVLLSRTPIPIFVQVVFKTFVWAGRITEFTDFASMLPIQAKAPYFVMFHTMAPHSPYRFTAECKHVRVFQDISEALYLEQLKCIDKQLVATVKTIIEQDPDAVIILQSDHGFWTREQSSTPMLEWSERRKRISMSFLGAYRLPEPCRRFLPEEMSKVNAFRVVLACIDGNAKPLLPNRSYLPIWVYHPGAANEVYEWTPSPE